jgi:hypothetical protein
MIIVRLEVRSRLTSAINNSAIPSKGSLPSRTEALCHLERRLSAIPSGGSLPSRAEAPCPRAEALCHPGRRLPAPGRRLSAIPGGGSLPSRAEALCPRAEAPCHPERRLSAIPGGGSSPSRAEALRAGLKKKNAPPVATARFTPQQVAESFPARTATQFFVQVAPKYLLVSFREKTPPQPCP